MDDLKTAGPLAHLRAPDDERFLPISLRLLDDVLRLGQRCQVWRVRSPHLQAPVGTFIPTDRFTHTCHVISIAGDMACELGLNCYLALAGASGHDLGHTPKGHFGEQWIGNGFQHELFGLVIAEKLLGLELPYEVAQCMACHSWHPDIRNRSDLTQECRVVAIADKIAYCLVDALEFRQILAEKGLGHYRPVRKIRARLQGELDDILTRIDPAFKPFGYLPLRERGFFFVTPEQEDRWRRKNLLNPVHGCLVSQNMMRRLMAAAVEESKAVGRVQFEHSPAALLLAELRGWLKQNVWVQADHAWRDREELDCAHRAMKRLFPKLDARVVTLLLNDIQVRRICVLSTGKGRAVAWKDNWGDVSEDIRDRLQPLLENLILQGGTIDIFARPSWL